MTLLTVLLQAAAQAGLGVFGLAFSTALVVLGAAFGIATIGKTAVESIARQPEAGADIRTSMIIAAALIEGVALFAIVVCGFIL